MSSIGLAPAQISKTSISGAFFSVKKRKNEKFENCQFQKILQMKIAQEIFLKNKVYLTQNIQFVQHRKKPVLDTDIRRLLSISFSNVPKKNRNRWKKNSLPFQTCYFVSYSPHSQSSFVVYCSSTSEGFNYSSSQFHQRFISAFGPILLRKKVLT
jgi:hypothetical protein